jgi:hypothetical protein
LDGVVKLGPKSIQVNYTRFHRRFRIEVADWLNKSRLEALSRQVALHAPAGSAESPVAFFRASTGIRRMNLNNAFHQLAAWSLRLQGMPAAHMICGSGMSRCVLGTRREDPQAGMPCRQCIGLSRRMAARAPQAIFPYHAEAGLAELTAGRGVEELAQVEWDGLPVGQIVLPSLRWVLRRHNLDEDASTRFLFREYMLSAWNVYREACAFLDRIQPRALVVFNGMFFPEAVARRAARQRGIPSYSHEVGMRPYSAFFTGGEATAYPLEIPPGFELTPEQEARLDETLSQRFKGDFTMAGIRFWPEMRGLDEGFLRRAEGFRQIVPVFSNVIFDTSQPHSNTVFPDMFAWLEMVLQLASGHQDTLFVIRAHPDEKRPGKESHETVSGWLDRHPLKALPNLVFYDSLDFVSSYELIQRSKFVMVYNSSIGLEASILGKGVLNGGRARYTGYPTVFFPPTPEAYRQLAEDFLAAGRVVVPAEYPVNARRFLYYQLFRSSLPFERYLQAHPLPGFVQLRSFSWEDLLPQNSPALRVISNGLLHGKPFLLEE